MKIEIESIDELSELISVLSPVYLRHCNDGLGHVGTIVQELRLDTSDINVDELADGIREALTPSDEPTGVAAEEPDGLPTDIPVPDIATRTFDTLQRARGADDELPECDADGVPHNTDWHSDPAKINADGRWRARRKRDEDDYKAWLLEQAVKVAEAAIAPDEAEPVATETHALPQDEDQAATEAGMAAEAGSDPRDGSAVAHGALPASAVDLAALIAASLEAAQDASDSPVDLLNACRDFKSKHGHPAFTALKAAVAPDDTGGGKALQHFTPGERRLMQACIANYPSQGA